jgi:hypothetical protein
MKMPTPIARMETPKVPPAILRIPTSSNLNCLKLGRKRLHYILQSDEAVKDLRHEEINIHRRRGGLLSIGKPGAKTFAGV